MAKGPKKSKAQIEEERLLTEEEARKAKIIEEKRNAEEVERKRVEDLRIKEERRVFREQELVRLAEELTVVIDDMESRRQQLAAEEKTQSDKAEWESFVNPQDEFGALNEKDFNTFLSSVQDNTEVKFEEVFALVQTIQKVCQGTEKRWTESLCSQNMSELAICEENIKRCCDCIIKKLDGATIQILRFIEAHISADRQELFLDSHAKGISVGLWGSCADIRPVRKSIMFDNMGVQIDVPKQILQHDACFTFRVLRIRNDFLTISAYCPSLANARADKSKYVVGDLIILDILKSPPRAQTLRAKKWTIRDKSSTSLSVQRSAYPSSVVSKVSVKVPEDVMMSEALSVAVWDEKEMAWSESGISDYQYSESTGHIQFNCCIVGTFALVKARAADFPYRKWSMCPTRSLAAKDADFEGMSARFTINTVSADLVIDILGTCVKLVQPNTRYLSDLIGVEMSSGSLVRQLQQRGYNLMPITTKENSKKDYDLAMAVLQQIARCASSFDFEGASDWNSTLGDSQSKQIGMRLRESTAFIGGLDVFNYECVLAEVDAQSQSQLHAPEVGAMGGSGVKFSLVVGDEYKSQTRFSHALRPLEVSHADLKSSMTNRMTAETSARIDQQNVRFEKNVFEFLRLVRPFNCS